MYDKYEPVIESMPEVLWRKINNLALEPEVAKFSESPKKF
jgi:hypothetical protein